MLHFHWELILQVDLDSQSGWAAELWNPRGCSPSCSCRNALCECVRACVNTTHGVCPVTELHSGNIFLLVGGDNLWPPILWDSVGLCFPNDLTNFPSPATWSHGPSVDACSFTSLRLRPYIVNAWAVISLPSCSKVGGRASFVKCRSFTRVSELFFFFFLEEEEKIPPWFVWYSHKGKGGQMRSSTAWHAKRSPARRLPLRFLTFLTRYSHKEARNKETNVYQWYDVLTFFF